MPTREFEKYPNHLQTLVELLRYRSAESPDETAYVFLEDGENEADRLTWGELDRRARALAVALEETTRPGDRALLLYPQGLDFVTAFFACQYAGIIAVPTKAPAGVKKNVRLDTIVRDARASAALTTPVLREKLSARIDADPDLKALRWITAGDDAGADSWSPPSSVSDTMALFQYTSGSTSDPRGVMVTHGNLMHNLDAGRIGWGGHGSRAMVSWVPTFHDLGLVFGMLFPVYAGFRCYMMAPAAFLARPMRWLEAISRYRATHTSGPNFSFDLVVDRSTPEQRRDVDLSSWQFTINGAEPIRASTMRRFADAFASSGFDPGAVNPGFGLAECTLRVTCRQLGLPPFYLDVDAAELARNRVVTGGSEGLTTLVGSGNAVSDTRIVIVDPETRQPLPPDRVGEIWVSGRSVAAGYWNRPEETGYTFGARTADGAGPFLRTGDLGFLKDGELFVTGRIKDVLIIHGLNHYPQDIEYTVENAHPALRPSAGAAVSIRVTGEERLVIVQELTRKAMRGVDAVDVFGAIRQAIAEEHDLQTHAIALVATGSVPKTSSGKIQRQACRRAFLEGTLNVVEEWRQSVSGATARSEAKPAADPAAVRTRVLEILESLLKVGAAEIDTTAPFARYGMDSVSALALSSELGESLDRKLPATLAYDYPSVDRLVDHLTRHSTRRPGFRHSKAVREPIAIVGIGCRFPGASGPEAFWELLESGRDAIREVPASRWNLESVYDPEPGTSDRTYSRWGGFVDAVDGFDADFFGISPREAENMDPQQRLLMEVCWEALEDAGIPPSSLAGTPTGVFVGISTSDYYTLQLSRMVRWNAYTGTGMALSMAAARIAYLLDLHGPALSVDTACSSSLVAVDAAIRALSDGECDTALAGGVNLILSAELTIALSQARMLSPTGRSRAFDREADGYVRSEGCGVVALRRLEDAIASGDEIVAVIHGSGVNQDGRTNGLTAPNGDAQKALLRRALASAAVSPAEVTYVEAHGTGTILGDPIELNALKEVLGEGRSPEDPVIVGSVKTNIGHLESAAGIAGLVKTALALSRRTIPPHLHFNALNPHVAEDGAGLRIPTRAESWPARRPALASVSSFGFGGTNACVVVGSAPSRAPDSEGPQRPIHVLPLSARSEAALSELVSSTRTAMAGTHAGIGDWCHIAAIGRDHHEYRVAFVGDSISGMRDSMGRAPAFRKISPDARRIAFLYTGQGAQVLGMGRQLAESDPEFRSLLESLAGYARPYLERDLLSVVWGDDGSELTRTEYTQPALFAIEVALTDLWRRWGIVPVAVLGHSIGEYAAAVAAGVMDRAQAMRLVCERGRLMGGLGPGGAMAAVAADEASVQALSEVDVAAVNGPRQVVISGEAGAIESACRRLDADGIRAVRLKVSEAFHSRRMDSVLERFSEVAGTLDYGKPEIGFVRTGPHHEDWAGYWTAQIRGAVRFEDGLRELARAHAPSTYVEIGPAPILTGMARQWMDRGEWIPSLGRGRNEWSAILEGLGRLYELGATVDWKAYDRGPRRRRVSLPTYPFQRTRYWIDTIDKRDAAPDPAATDDAPILFQPVWRRRPGSSRDVSESWLLIGPSRETAALAAELGDRGHRVATASDADAVTGEDDAVTGAVSVEGVTRIVDLRALAANRNGTISEDTSAAEAGRIEAAIASGASTLLTRAAAMASPPRVDVVVRGALADAALEGLARTAALEFPAIWGSLIDVAMEPANAAFGAALAGELTAAEPEAVVRLEPDVRLVERLIPWRGPSVRAEGRFGPDETCWIAGGVGAIGLELASWLVDQGVRNLVLSSRRPPSASAAKAIDALVDRGVRVDCVAADLADEGETVALVARIEASGKPLSAVFLLAGVARSRPISELGPEDFEETFRAKVSGAWAAHRATRRLNLRYFVCFSSIAAAWGAPGLAAYGAGNRFLDALVEYRSRQGLPGLALDWSAWSTGGMLGSGAADRARSSGLRPLDADRAFRALDELIDAGLARAVVADVDWSVFKPAFEAVKSRRLFDEISAPAERRAGDKVRPGSGLGARLEAAAAEARPRLMRAFLEDEIALLLKLESGRKLDVSKGFFTMGMDSLMAVDLRKRLESELGVELPPTAAFDYPTIEDLSAFLLGEWNAGSPAGSGSGVRGSDYARNPPLVDPTDDEILRRLEHLEALIRDS